MYSLESPHRGDSNEFTQYTVFNIKKVILNYPKSAGTECVPRDSRTSSKRGWSCGAMVLGKPPVPGRPTILIRVGQEPIALAVGAGWACLDICTLIYPFFPLSPSLLGDGPI